jgi:hypothetical protein
MVNGWCSDRQCLGCNSWAPCPLVALPHAVHPVQQALQKVHGRRRGGEGMLQ